MENVPFGGRRRRFSKKMEHFVVKGPPKKKMLFTLRISDVSGRQKSGSVRVSKFFSGLVRVGF